MHINYLIDNYKAISIAVISTSYRLPVPVHNLLPCLHRQQGRPSHRIIGGT